MNELTQDSHMLEIMLSALIVVVFVGLFYEYGKRKKWDKPSSPK